MSANRPATVHTLRMEYEGNGKTRKANLSIPGSGDQFRQLALPAGERSGRFPVAIPAGLKGLCLMASRPMLITAGQTKLRLTPAMPTIWADAMDTPTPLAGPIEAIEITVEEPDDELAATLDLFAIWEDRPEPAPKKAAPKKTSPKKKAEPKSD